MRFSAIQFSTHLADTDAALATSRFLTSPEVSAAASVAGRDSPGALLFIGSCFARMNTQIKHETRYVTKNSFPPQMNHLLSRGCKEMIERFPYTPFDFGSHICTPSARTEGLAILRRLGRFASR
jgi:hypothetical protein